MDSGVIFLMFTYFSVAGSEIHTLEYIYTALSKPLKVPGVYEFTAMGIVDNKQIDYYNSKDQYKVPRQTWMSEKLDDNYWKKGTSSRKSKEQWFKVNVEILMTRMNDSRGGLHVLQWRHGCKGEPQPDGKLAFRDGFDQYSYDGGDFLSFDPGTLQWVAPVSQAWPTKNKWDHSQTLNQYTEGYLKNECMEWLNKFMHYGEKDLKNQNAPMVFTPSKTAKTPGNVTLYCLATGLYSRDVEIDIYRKNDLMTEADGANSTGIRPSEFTADGTMAKTYQLKKLIEILESDLDLYNYKVTYRGEVTATGKWEAPKDSKGGYAPIIGGVIVIILAVAAAAVAAVLFRKKISESCASALRRFGSKNTVSSDGSSNPSDTDVEKQNLTNGKPNMTCIPGAAIRIQPNGKPNGTGSPEAEKLMQPNGKPNGTGSPEAGKSANGH